MHRARRQRAAVEKRSAFRPWHALAAVTALCFVLVVAVVAYIVVGAGDCVAGVYETMDECEALCVRSNESSLHKVDGRACRYLSEKDDKSECYRRSHKWLMLSTGGVSGLLVGLALALLMRAIVRAYLVRARTGVGLSRDPYGFMSERPKPDASWTGRNGSRPAHNAAKRPKRK